LLAERLKEIIRARGPITFRDWMEVALYDPAEGYYNRTDLQRWGREGDYRTSPERSELFASTFARYFARLYDELERPAEWTIVEGGAGEGLFAQGVLRNLAHDFSPVFAATRYCIEETSPDSVARARETLSEFKDRVSFGTPCELGTGIYFSNELLDAFPVHRIVDKNELYVALDADDKFTWSAGPFSTQRLSKFLKNCSVEFEPGQAIEVNLAIDDWLADVAARLKRGYVITVDYGAEATELYDTSLRPEGTLRAFSKHGFVDDVLSEPGAYDITSSVDWTQVKAAGKRLGLQEVEFASQDKFLLRAGLLDELNVKLLRAPTNAEKMSLTTSVKEMILPGGMSSSFQVLVQKRV
jgi:SAM-dependent MidA family methyltransferase